MSGRSRTMAKVAKIETAFPYVATVEKAIVDSLYFGSPPISYVEEASSESLRRKIINLNQSEDFTVRMKTKAVAKSVETLLRIGNIDSARLQEVM